MTRETKVGLVVSCSFLCLVGTVVYVKYTQRGSHPNDARVKFEDPTLTIPADPTPAPPTGVDAFVATTRPETKESPVLTASPSMVDPNVQRAASAQNSTTFDALPAPVFPETNSTANPVTDVATKDIRRDEQPPPPPTWEATGAPRSGDDQIKAPANAGGSPDSKQTPTFAPLPEPEPSSETQAPAFVPGGTNTTPSPFPPPPSPVGSDTPAPAFPAPSNEAKPFPTPPPPADVEPGAAPPAPSPPSGMNSPASTGSEIPAPLDPPQAKSEPVPEATVKLNAPVANPRPDQTATPTRPGSDWDRNPRTLPPVGATGTVTSPPIAVPVPPSSTVGRSTSNFVPQVESYDEETYPCRTGDTLETISQRYYNTDKYARALLLFNRNHPRPAAGLSKEPPLVVDGQPVYIPPPHILEKYYAYALPTSKASPSFVIPATGTTPGNAAAATPRPGPRYVTRQAEMVSAVARNTLGNLERWSEIYELNGRGFDPSRPIPAGTVLTMPADARVPDANMQ